MSNRFRFFASLHRLVCAGLAVVAGLALAQASPAPAEAVITNEATATYFNTRLGVIEVVRSNRVEVVVLPVPALDVTGGGIVTLPRGASGLHSFQVRNTGNTALRITADMIERSGDDFDVSGTLIHDADRDGSPSITDPALTATTGLSIEPGERMTLFHRFDTPVTTVADDRARSLLRIEATSKGGRIEAEAEAEAVIVEAALALLKSGSLRADDNEIDYTLAVRNNAETDILPYASIKGDPITLDGEAISAVVVRDVIPLNTHLVSAMPGGGFVPVYHRRGDAEHAYRSTPLVPRQDMDAVAFIQRDAFKVGRDSDLRFTVEMVETVDEAEISNIANAYLATPEGTLDQPSNVVITRVSGPGHRIQFRDSESDEVIEFSPFNRNFRIRVGAATCNLTQERDRVIVTVKTTFAGDEEQIIAFETGENTGIFYTAPTAIIRVESATQNNAILEGAPGDAAGATATAVCLGEPLIADLQVQPGGFVFDSVTNQPVVGASVFAFTSAASPTPGGITTADILARRADGSMVSESMTDESGYYDLGAIPRGKYRIDVRPPVSHAHPSVRKIFDGYNRTVDPTISYGALFSFDGGPLSGLDIPVDPGSTTPLALDKSINQREVRRGGFVLYTLHARNNLAQALLKARITDMPPRGFQYLDGSAQLDGEPLTSAPVIAPDGSLTFDLDLIRPNSDRILTYGMRVGPATRPGPRVNRAILSGEQAGTAVAFATPEARASVRVEDRGGVFADEAVVIGRVFLDRNGDGIQTDAQEPGVPGVKIVTATGLAAVTDAFGRYSLIGLRPATTVFSVIRGTLPANAQPQESDVDDLRDPLSRLIDLKRGDLRGEDFVLTWTPEAAAEVARRLDAEEGLDRDASQLRDDLPLGFDTPGRLSSRSQTARDTTTESLRPLPDGAPSPSPTPRRRDGAPVEAVENAIRGLDARPGFVGIADGHVAAGRSLTLRIKSPIDVDLSLTVNGETVPESTIGAQAFDRDSGVQLFEYVAVPLNQGANTLTIGIVDPFGNPRGGQTIKVYAPGDPVGLEIVAPASISASGRARAPVVVRIVDAEGRLVRAPAEVTLSAERGQWDVRDIRDGKPGLQAFIDHGEATFDFIPPDLVGAETLRAEADFGSASAQIAVTPDLNERVFVGVVEGAIAFGEKGSQAIDLIEDRDISIFEETTEGLRGQLYLKGRIRGDALLTLRYDSDQDTNERLFRDIRRDEFYPVYGDNSERGFDAQSSSQLYVKVEKGTSYMLYGDIAVEPRSDAIRLGAYRRSVTGGAVHLEQGPVTVDLFVAQTDQAQRIIEIDGRGVSGPYDVSLDGIRDGSEVVEIIVRDRDQTSVILSEQTQDRMTDYVLDFFAGTIIFNRPIPRLDDDLNPVSIRVTYETDEGAGDDYLIYGGEARVALTETIAIGYRELRSDADRSSDERRAVRSAYIEGDLQGWGHAQIEVSQTHNSAGAEGNGLRAAYDWAGRVTTVRAEAARTDEDFDAPGSSVAPGREEARILVEHRIGDRLTLGAEGLYSRNLATGETRLGAELRARMQATDGLDLIAGGRAVHSDETGGTTDETYSAIVGAVWRPAFVPGASLRAEYEQDFVDLDRRRILLGADYQVDPRMRFYGLTELSTARSGTFGLGDTNTTALTTKIGTEYRFNDQISGYSEYRETAGSGLSGMVANGVRGSWRITERVSLRSGFEHIEPTANAESRETSAYIGAVYDNVDAGLILRGDLEADHDTRGLGWFANTSFAYSFDDDLTLLARNRLAVDDRDEGRIRDRLRLGAALRPAHDSRWKALALYEYELDDDDTSHEQSHRWTIAGSYAPRDDARFSLKYAGEQYRLDSDGFEDSGALHLVRAGAEVDLVKNRLSLAGNAMVFTDDAAETLVTGIGAEVKLSVAKNVQVGAGYNYVDIDEDRLRDLYRAGWFLRLRLKLGDDLWSYLDEFGVTEGGR